MIKKWFKGIISVYYGNLFFSRIKIKEPLSQDYSEESFILKAIKEQLKDDNFKKTEIGLFFEAVEQQIESEKIKELLKIFSIKATKKKFINNKDIWN